MPPTDNNRQDAAGKSYLQGGDHSQTSTEWPDRKDGTDDEQSVVTLETANDETDTRLLNSSDDSGPNVYVAARGRIQRYVDVALLISNMSQLATVIKRSDSFNTGQYIALVTTLSLAMTAEIIAAIFLYVAQEQDEEDAERAREGKAVPHRRARMDVAAYALVGLVMLLNLFASTFLVSWTDETTSASYSQPVVGFS